MAAGASSVKETISKASAKNGEASVIVSGLSGNIYSDLQFDIGLAIHELKKIILPAISPGASDDAQLKLFFDGSEPDDGETLAGIGIDASEQAHFTALIYDPRALVVMEINRMHREAIERSHYEAEEARKRKRDIRNQLIAERKQAVESEYTNRHGQAQGPLLMLAAEPAWLPDTSRNGDGSSRNTAGVNAACSQGVAASSDESQGLLMLAAEPAYPLDMSRNGHSSSSNIAGANASSDRSPGLPMLAAQPAPPEVVKVPNGFAPVKSPSRASPDWRTKASEIVAAYDAFFDHISFRKGWKEPPFAREDAALSLAMAARIVARARIETLDIRDEGIKLRQVEGSARDWMHSPECGLLLQSNPDLFMTGVVHATFKDARGYVEGLQESEVDGFIKKYSPDTTLVN